MRPRSPLPARTELILLLALLVPMTGCGAPPALEQQPVGPLPSLTTPAPPTTAPEPPASPAPPAPTGVPTDTSVALDCGGEPGPDEVLAVLHDDSVLAEATDATVVEGPLCVADWHFTVVRVADRDPLQVITSGSPGDLALVTAGTDVCTIEVRVHAPPGIRTAAGCVG